MVFIILLAGFRIGAQGITVHGRFLEHTARIGERVPYSLSVHHPAASSVVFPDSTYSYSPFEAEKKIYFRTKTRDDVSVDSAIYYLTTYEIDSIQYLRLPVFVLHHGDSTEFYTATDSVVLNLIAGPLPESVAAKDLPLKTNADYLHVRWLLNYPVIMAIAGGLVLVLIILWVIFGKRIRKYYRLKRLEKNHATFLSRFARHVDQLRQNLSLTEAETTMADWKKYMEGLANKPFTKLTTREILKLVSDEALGRALQRVDRILYARDESFPEEAFEALRSYSQSEFAKKAEEVKNG